MLLDVRRYEEQEAISVSEKLSRLEKSENNELSHGDGDYADDKQPVTTSADSNAETSSAGQSYVNTDHQPLGQNLLVAC